ncbi:MAG: protein translocase subunit SecDF [Saprospiraceae bacterium]|nr:protein translocase subunit SecDF [Saprospiraceae bacterium]
MQGKGIVKFFLVIMTIVCVVQYLFILPTMKVEKKAEEYAKSYAQNYPEEEQPDQLKSARTAYLDSMSRSVVFSIPLIKDYTYQDLKSQQLALGLDLKGGMSVVLQVDLREFIRALANDSTDPTFENALNQATASLKDAQSDYITLFARAWQDLAEGKKMSKLFQQNESLREDINANTSDGDVTRILRDRANETVQLTYKRLKERIDKLGVSQPNVSLDEARDLIIVDLPGIDNPERARAFLVSTAKLEFWDTYRISDPGIAAAFAAADQKLAAQDAGTDTETSFTLDTLYVTDALGNVDSTQIERVDTVRTTPADLGQYGPLFERLALNTQNGFSPAVMGTAKRNQKDAILNMLRRPDIKSLFPPDAGFRWSKDAIDVDDPNDPLAETFSLYLIKMPGGKDKPLLEGGSIVSTNASPDTQTGEMQVTLRMDQAGSRIWGQMTQRAYQDGNREVAITLDDEIASAPRVINPILGGNTSITGSFSTQEANDLAGILEIGKLPAKTSIIQESLVGPTLGAENISNSIRAMIFGVLLVLLFMILYYGTAGVVSIIALFMNVFFILGALASIGTVLTLPGIAGIVLTIGMAVDANVIIYERIREELRDGKSLRSAISDGFSNSYSAIIDANVTTILTAIILAVFGLGPIKGFAVVLIVGVLSSLFTAVLLGRLIIDWWVGKGRDLSFWTGISKDAFANLNIDWLGKRRIAYTISGLIILAGIGSFFVRGFDLGVDFKGGYSYNIEFTQDVSADQLRESLTAVFDGAPTVKAVDTENTFGVVTSYNIDSEDPNADSLVMVKLHEGVNSMLGGNISYEKFRKTDSQGVTHVTSSTKVGPTIADDIKSSAWEATVFALLLIFFYIFIRFSKWQYSLGAVTALFHDVLIVLSVFTLLHGILPFAMEVDQAFIAALLSVIGYSINDTVVVFDRIREFSNLYTGKSKEDIINMAVNSTVSRTVITSLTTLFVVLVLFIFGGGSIKGFAFAFLVGIVVGTYSSIFIATPVMSDLTGTIDAKPTTDKKGGFSRAATKAK